ncbi:defensin beta 136 [Cavia porcellus]|uniref:Defensin beta 136 n=1 Tax=Cavia porcellus TaxID=10141 RepID=H0UU52_CAVPO|nr:beta-defensin 136 [Cavia porcellus]
MNLYLSGFLFLLMVPLTSGHGLFGNSGVVVRTCTALNGLCFFGCKPGWTFVAFCHNILVCCRKDKKFSPPQANEV